jgi:hypothetical protein
MGNNGDSAKGFEFKKFATPRIVGGIAIVVIVLWALTIIFGPSKVPSSGNMAESPHDKAVATEEAGSAHQAGSARTAHSPAASPEAGHQAAPSASGGHDTAADESTGEHGAPAAQKTTATHATDANDTADAKGHGTTDHGTTAQKTAGSHGTMTAHKAAAHDEPATRTKAAAHQPAAHGGPATQAKSDAHQPVTHRQPATTHDRQASSHGATDQTAAQRGGTTGHAMPSTVDAPIHKPTPKGVAFVEAAIKPLQFELEERWWGWRPNDIIDLTDNVNNFQMGVLEVTRRTTVALAERISRTGTTDAFDENLEQAMNWFMIKASSFWFPSAESKYRDGLEELGAYLEKLKAGKATFFTRTDNLIPLLASFEDLMGSCDENLVKETNDDGTELSSFDVDNYFFYTQGVASSMATVLEAVHHDFLLTLESRNATELLHHAIVSCQRAASLDPWIILDRDLSSIFANHRANMAAPISHARFYLGQLIKTLST